MKEDRNLPTILARAKNGKKMSFWRKGLFHLVIFEILITKSIKFRPSLTSGLDSMSKR